MPSLACQILFLHGFVYVNSFQGHQRHTLELWLALIDEIRSSSIHFTHTMFIVNILCCKFLNFLCCIRLCKHFLSSKNLDLFEQNHCGNVAQQPLTLRRCETKIKVWWKHCRKRRRESPVEPRDDAGENVMLFSFYDWKLQIGHSVQLTVDIIFVSCALFLRKPILEWLKDIAYHQLALFL